LKTATYYGCTLVRPRNVAIEPPGSTRLMDEFLRALGAEPLSFSDAFTCCGSYQILANPEAAVEVSAGHEERFQETAPVRTLPCHSSTPFYFYQGSVGLLRL